MKSYSETANHLFSPGEQDLLSLATAMVAAVPDELLPAGEVVRCHELARAVGGLLDLPFVDGHYGFVDHSWLWTRRPTQDEIAVSRETRLGFPNILDVYSVGQLPMVRLVDGQHTSLPHVGWSYRPGAARSDIDGKAVQALSEAMRPTLVRLRAAPAAARSSVSRPPPTAPIPSPSGICTYCGVPRSQCDPFSCREHG